MNLVQVKTVVCTLLLSVAVCGVHANSRNDHDSVQMSTKIRDTYPAECYYGKNWPQEDVRLGKYDWSCIDNGLILPLIAEGESSYHKPADEVRLISPYGVRGRRMHTGADLKLSHGDPVYSVFDGVVRMAKYYSGYGNIIVVRHYNGLETAYSHLSKMDVKSNDVVKAGDIIGKAGRTGRATTDHLHFEVRFLCESMNPSRLINLQTGELLSDTMYITKNTFKNKDNNDIKVPSQELAINEESELESDLEEEAQTQVEVQPQVKETEIKPKTVQVASVKNVKWHTIQKGDTLYSISRKYKVSIDTLCRLNNITESSILSIGTKLKLIYR